MIILLRFQGGKVGTLKIIEQLYSKTSCEDTESSRAFVVKCSLFLTNNVGSCHVSGWMDARFLMTSYLDEGHI